MKKFQVAHKVVLDCHFLKKCLIIKISLVECSQIINTL